MAKKSNKRRELRITWTSNGFWTQSGYGVFTKDILTRMRDDGWPVAMIAFWGLQGNPIEIEGIKCYPCMGDAFGSDSMFYSSMDFKANVAFTMYDLQMIQPQFLKNLTDNNVKFIPYLPIDQEPVIPQIKENLKFAHKIISFSSFGKRVLEDSSYVSKLILEGTDTNIFKPEDKIQARRDLGIPEDSFLFTMVAANKENPPRKGFQEVLEAFKMFHDVHPEAAILFHTQQTSPTNFPLLDYARHLGIHERCFFVDQYKATYFSNSKQIAKEMNAADIVLQPSQTEGFGLTSVEAQSCGKPVLVGNNTAQPEMIIPGVTGELVETKHNWWRSGNGYVHITDSKSLYEGMEKIFKRLQDDPKKVAKDCRDFVLEKFNIDKIYKEQWTPYLEALQEELLPLTVNTEESSIKKS